MPAGGLAGGTVLPEVQALRALAVAVVVLFHFWPGYLPGGFIGVDVFFVISGFLITGQIARSIENGTFTFGSFYLRRARRLLPAACLVLLLTAAAVLILLPASRWRDPMWETLASALYVQNWALALGSSDYFRGDPTPVQHYWSLSIEEQFYLFWPLTIVALWWPGRKVGGARRPVVAGLTLVCVASFLASVVVTSADPSLGYFATYTRMWEFGVGGILALIPRWRGAPSARALVSWSGWLTIVASALLMNEGTLFPGWVAALPVAGAVAVIAAGLPQARWSASALAGARPVQVLGDISYSTYLWHWPLIIIPAAMTGGALSAPTKLGLLLACLALASLTKRYVEDRLREHRPSTSPATGAAAISSAHGGRTRLRARSTVVLFALFVAAVTVSGGGAMVVESRTNSAQALEARAIAAQVPCFGAAMLRAPDCDPPFGDAMVPDPAGALQQFTGSWVHDHCFVDSQDDDLWRCDVGAREPVRRVALLGDSHALMWYPALRRVARAEGWRVSTFLRGSCPASAAVPVRPTAREQGRCERWQQQAVDAVTADRSIDLVLTTSSTYRGWVPEDGLSSFETGVRGYQRAWQRFVESGKRVVVLRDTPRPRANVLDCLAGHADRSRCGRTRESAVAAAADPSGGEPLAAAVYRLGDDRVSLLDLHDQICRPAHCDALIGNVVVYVDESHLSPTYSRTLAPELGRTLSGLMAR